MNQASTAVDKNLNSFCSDVDNSKVEESFREWYFCLTALVLCIKLLTKIHHNGLPVKHNMKLLL